MTTLHTIFDAVKPFRLPPVADWQPEKTVEFDLVIRSDGRWVHEGDEIRRHNLIKLFSTVLALRDGDYYLVTPPARYRISVEDTPFQVVELDVKGSAEEQTIWFRTDMDETFALDVDHPVDPRIDPQSGEPSPVVTVRDGLTGRLVRSVYYQLAELAREHPPCSGHYGVFSAGAFHSLS